jgi:Endonuclease-reverse transcriptase
MCLHQSIIFYNISVIICGDFNFPSVDWKSIDPGLGANDTYLGIFLNLYVKHALNQSVSQRTHTTLSSNSTLDLIRCNDPNFILNT